MEPSLYSLPDYDESGDLISTASPIRKVTSGLESSSFSINDPPFTSDMESQCIHQSIPDVSHIIKLHKTGSFEVERMNKDKGDAQSPCNPNLHRGRGIHFVPYSRRPLKMAVKLSPDAGSLFEVHNSKSEQAMRRARGLTGDTARTEDTRNSSLPMKSRESKTLGLSGDSHHPVVSGHTFPSTYPTHTINSFSTDPITESNFQELLYTLESICSLLEPMNMLADGVSEDIQHIRNRLQRVWLEHQQKRSSEEAVLSISSTTEPSIYAHFKAAFRAGGLAFRIADICLSSLEKYSRDDELKRREYKERIQALQESGVAAVRKAVQNERKAAAAKRRMMNEAIQSEKSDNANNTNSSITSHEMSGSAIGNIEKQLRIRCEYLEKAMEEARQDLKVAIENRNSSQELRVDEQ